VKNKSLFIFICFIVFPFACKEAGSNGIERVLTRGAYWDIIEGNRKTAYCYKFEDNGVCYYYYYYHNTNQRKLYASEDEIISNTWTVNNKKDKIWIQRLERDIISFNRDTVLLFNKGNNTKIILVRSTR
jgi:hypothetical protein